MRERPILFNGAMVRAILAGQKTQTRRAVAGVRGDNCLCLKKPTKTRSGIITHVLDAPGHGLCPFGQPGDRLWVRETWQFEINAIGSAREEDGPFVYAADDGYGDRRIDERWRPSIHMPRWVCRLVLEITAVRVERLQAISTQDCLAEGITTRFKVADAADELRIQFRDIWNDTGGDWESNPWVWVIEFNRINEVSNG
ncbi:hypothetical protein [Stenotrophomonas nematodicola]|uniref:hypothetical protein n=1 Tax=Stenotrophomonas nematodicola TaxID=2656746 RepID=UPI0012908C87|nr:hypothetical protein [Stenotrophomonas nematodicola]